MKIYNFTIKTFQRNLLIATLLVIAILYNFSGIFFGLDFTDSFYHLNQAINPANGIYLYPFFLSSIIIKEIVEVTGPEVINLRVVNWFLISFSICFPFLFLKVKKERPPIFFYIGIILILYNPFNVNILGYDTLSIFILSLLFSITALYLKIRKYYLIAILSLICAAAIIIRLPNVLTIPIIFLFLFVSEGFSKKDWGLQKMVIPGVFLLSTCALVLISYSLYYKNWEEFVSATSNSSSHDLLLLFSNYLKDGFKIIGFIFLVLFGWYGYKKLLQNSLPQVKDGTLIIFFIVSLSFFVGYAKFSVNYSLFLVALAISLVLVQTYYSRREKLSDSQLILYLFLCFLFINPFGSNTGLLKSYSLLLLLPFVLSIIRIQDKKYWLILVAVLIPFSVLTKVFGVYEDKNLFLLDKKLTNEKLSSIYTSSFRKEYLSKTDDVVKQLKAQGIEVYFYGDKAHIFHYLYPKTNLIKSSFHQPVDDPGFLLEIENALQGKKDVALFVVNSYPNNSPSPLSLLEQGMVNNSSYIVEGDLVKYYLRTSSIEN